MKEQQRQFMQEAIALSLENVNLATNLRRDKKKREELGGELFFVLDNNTRTSLNIDTR